MTAHHRSIHEAYELLGAGTFKDGEFRIKSLDALAEMFDSGKLSFPPTQYEERDRVPEFLYALRSQLVFLEADEDRIDITVAMCGLISSVGKSGDGLHAGEAARNLYKIISSELSPHKAEQPKAPKVTAAALEALATLHAAHPVKTSAEDTRALCTYVRSFWDRQRQALADSLSDHFGEVALPEHKVITALRRLEGVLGPAPAATPGQNPALTK